MRSKVVAWENMPQVGMPSTGRFMASPRKSRLPGWAGTPTRSILPLASPMPNKAPQETCVVETGNPAWEAKITSRDVIKFAENPWPWLMAVILCDMVSATRRALKNPPSAIIKTTPAIFQCSPNMPAATEMATIFGVSFSPRAKLTAPALKK